MKKIFKMEDLDCANCAAKMENSIKNIDGVEDCVVSFMTQKMTLIANDEKFEDIVKQAVKLCKKIEPGCVILVK